ncbi:MAG: hypothetical protein QXG01_06585 [Candidatus Bathyarchaeia archaeon]
METPNSIREAIFSILKNLRAEKTKLQKRISRTAENRKPQGMPRIAKKRSIIGFPSLPSFPKNASVKMMSRDRAERKNKKGISITTSFKKVVKGFMNLSRNL